MEKMTRRAGLFILLFPAALHAVPDAWDRAKTAYDKGDFAAARKDYESLAREGWNGAALSFNLGNTCARAGELGRARAWYERALAEAPRDEDVRANRDWVMAKLGLKEESTDPLAPWAGRLSVLFMALNALFFGLLWMRLGGRRGEMWWWSAWGSGLALAAVGILAWAAKTRAAQPWAIVTVPRTEARAEPNPDAPVGFTAPEGRKVALFQTSGDWIEIGLPDEAVKGWVPRAEVEALR